jgi:hypothetical protein
VFELGIFLLINVDRAFVLIGTQIVV